MIRNSNEINHNQNLLVLLYGQIGKAKSTTACSAPDPLVVDVDRGLGRMFAPARPASFIQPDTYQEVLNDLNGDLSKYRSIVIDTLGRFIELMAEHSKTVNPKFMQGDGTLTLKGWGWLGNEFGNFVKRLRRLNKHIVFVAHSMEENDGDTKVFRIDAGGRARKEIVKDMDLIGFTEMQGTQMTINFAPTERYYTKNSLGILAAERLPNVLEGAPNNYLTNLFLRAAQKFAEDGKLNLKYSALKTEINNLIEGVKNPETANACLDKLNKLEHVYHSLAEGKHLLADKVKAIGLTYDRETAKFKGAKAEKPAKAGK